VVVGGGPERPRLEAMVRDIAPRQVTFAGVLGEVESAYRVADMVVLPSVAGDSMPAVLIEAALCGLPSVATTVGAIADVVLDGKTGLLVPDAGSTSLTPALLQLTADASLRRRLGSQAERHCRQRFEMAAVVEQWERTLEAAAAQR
jgi:glycosyltransferase involved in cell wall biosynthesis